MFEYVEYVEEELWLLVKANLRQHLTSMASTAPLRDAQSHLVWA